MTERVLEKLDCPAPETTVAGLSRVYAAWCRKVPFDNIRKLIHVRGDDPGPLPGDTPEELFEAWLATAAAVPAGPGTGPCRPWA